MRPTRPQDKRQGFLAAVKEKYVLEPTEAAQAASEPQIVISGKVAEEIGFDKIWKKLSQVKDLKIVIVDALRIVAAGQEDDQEPISDACPRITNLDLSRNLFESLGAVVDICTQLTELRKLTIKYVCLFAGATNADSHSGNRFQNIEQDDALWRVPTAFRGVSELSLDETLMTWTELCAVATKCPSLEILNAGSNQLTKLQPLDYLDLTTKLTTINLEFNEFTALSELAGLTALTSLRNLHLKGNNISAVANNAEKGPVFPASVQYLDVSYNNISSWEFVDALPTHLPGLTGLRLAHNPVYVMQDTQQRINSSEESHMFTIARLAKLQSLNFAQVRPADRTNAEMFYLSRIAKQLATVPESAENTVLAQHPRYGELCGIYGEPDVVRRDEINPSFLEARLITVAFRLGDDAKTTRIPKAFDIYTVKSIAGKLFGLSPLRLRLVWETGEWDPVAGYAEQDGDDSSDEEEAADGPEDESGRWIKREVELKDGPRQLGYCVDGLDVSIRMET